MIDIERLKENLNNLRGLDFEQCAQQERAAGNTSLLLRNDERFLSRLAALALKINVHDIKELPLREYVDVIQTVLNFLFLPVSTTSDNSEG